LKELQDLAKPKNGATPNTPTTTPNRGLTTTPYWSPQQVVPLRGLTASPYWSPQQGTTIDLTEDSN